MDQARDILLNSIDYLTSWPGLLYLVLACFILKLAPGFRRMMADVVDQASVSLKEEDLAEHLRLSTSRSPVGAESEIANRYDEMVRREDWDDVHRQIRSDDAGRVHDPVSNMRAARVGVNVAMTEIARAVAHGGEAAEARVQSAVEAFEARLKAAPDDLAAAVLAAEAHMEVGWLYRGDGTIDTVSAEGLSRMQDHFERAGAILRDFEVASRGSPVLAAANFRLAVGLCGEELMFHAARAIWLKADPGDPEMMGQVAFHLLPRWYGSHKELHRAATEIADLTRAELGDQAYAMTILHVAVEEPDMVAALDVERLVNGAMERIEARGNDQETINETAAGLFYLMLNATGARRKALRQALRGIFQTKVRTLILDLWPDSLADIRLSLAPLFRQELNAGATITIDQDGYRVSHSEAG